MYNDQNEIILVVDNSYSTEQQKTSKDEYVKDVVMMTDPNAFKIGIVSFGYDYKLVADLSNDIGAVLDAYNAETRQPDIEATDIAEAVTYAASLFNNKQSAKIIIVSDGFETDGNAMSAVRNAVAEGIKVDTVCLSPNDSKDDVFSVVSCETPDYNVAESETFPLKLTVTNSSSKAISAKIALTDNNELASETVAEIKPGTQVVEIKHALVGEGLHTFNFTLTSEAGESATQNNQLYSYMLLNKFDKVLIIEGFAGESTKLKELLADYQVKTVYIGSTEMPTTLDELCQYDEIILNNVSNSDLQKHEGLDKLLNSYVYDIGGGIKNGKAFKAVQIGGPSGGCLTEAHMDLPMDFDSLKKAGAIIGSGGLVVMDEDTCMVSIAQFFMNFICNESCGKCTPCREGTTRMLDILTRITKGNGKPGDIEELRSLAKMIQNSSLCGLGKTAPNPVLSTLANFEDEYREHIFDKKCRTGSCRSLTTYVIDPAICKGCTKCARNCPAGAITGELKKPHHIDTDKCIKCGTCKSGCPFGAIKEA